MMFLPAELERGTKVLQFNVCCEGVDQNFDCGCILEDLELLTSKIIFKK